MVTKLLKSDSVPYLVRRIEGTKNNYITLRKPIIRPVEGRVTVLSLYSGKTSLGTIAAKTREEASRIASSKEVNLRVAPGNYYNKKVSAEFIY